MIDTEDGERFATLDISPKRKAGGTGADDGTLTRRWYVDIEPYITDCLYDGDAEYCFYERNGRPDELRYWVQRAKIDDLTNYMELTYG